MEEELDLTRYVKLQLKTREIHKIVTTKDQRVAVKTGGRFQVHEPTVAKISAIKSNAHQSKESENVNQSGESELNPSANFDDPHIDVEFN